MKKFPNYSLIIIFGLFIWLNSLNNVYAQTIDLDPSSKTIDGITNIAASIVADSFVPMTHYSKKKLYCFDSACIFHCSKGIR